MGGTVESDTGAGLCGDIGGSVSDRADISGVYAWPEVAKVLAVFFAPLVLVLAIGALWLLIDKDGLRQIALGMGSAARGAEALAIAITLPGTMLALGFMAAHNRRHGLTWAALGLRKAPVGRSLKYIAGFFVLSLLTVVGLIAVLIVLQVSGPEASAVRPARSAAEWIWLLAGAVIIGPLGEEVIHRGMIFGFLRHRHRIVVAALISAAVFALVHMSPTALVTAFPLGLYLCFMYQRLGSIVPGMILHMSWNLVVSLIR